MNIISKREAEARQSALAGQAREQQENFHMLIGSFMARWANTESLFISIFALMVSTSHENAQILYAGLSTPFARRETLNALAHQNLADSSLKGFVGLLGRFETETKIRNSIAHCEFRIGLPGTEYAGAYLSTINYSTQNLAKFGTCGVETPMDQKWVDKVEESMRRLSSIHDELTAMIKGGLAHRNSAHTG